MTEPFVFSFSLIAYGIFFILFAFYCLSSNQNNIAAREKLVREKIIGTVMAFVALIWCAKHGLDIFPRESIRIYFIPLAFILTWAAYILLDFLPARSLGALMILIAHYHLQCSFTLKSPFKPFFSTICFLVGTLGIIICGKPYILRDFFRVAAGGGNKKYSAVVFLFFLSAVYLLYGTYHVLHAARQ
jgi:hypothetical protein